MKNKLENAFGKIEQSDFNKRIIERKSDFPWLKYSQQIALEILEILDQKNISQKSFALLLNVSPQAVSKWLQGKENFTIETIQKIENALGINLIQIVNNSIQNQYVTSSVVSIKGNYGTSSNNYIGEKFPYQAKVIGMTSPYTYKVI